MAILLNISREFLFMDEYDEKELRKIAEQYKQGNTWKEIAEKHNMSITWVQNQLKKCRMFGYISEEEYEAHASTNKTVILKHMHERQREALEKKRREAVELFKQGKSCKFIADLYSMNAGSVFVMMKKCRALGYISEEEYRALARAHQTANLNRVAK